MYHFTGNPFVDAGIAGMAAAAKVGMPEQLTGEIVNEAVEKLLEIMTSSSAFVDSPPHKRFATSTVSMIFPNSPLPQSSYKTPEKKSEKYRERIKEFADNLELESSPIDRFCFACGKPALLRVGIDRFPLMSSESQLNFHPMLQEGHPLCGFCALAVQFLPFSLLQTKAEGGLLWFLHTLQPSLAITIAKDMGIKSMSEIVAVGQPLRFYGNWACGGEPGAVISLFLTLARKYAKQLEASKSPIAAYVFSNDNREQKLNQISIPNLLVRFFEILSYYSGVMDKLESEILRTPIGWKASERMLNANSIIRLSLLDNPPGLRGGWKFHQLYMQEVMGITISYIRTIEEIGRKIAENENSKKLIHSLREARNNEVFDKLLDFVRLGIVNRKQLYILAPPSEVWATIQARDYLLGVVYALQNGETFELIEDSEKEGLKMHPLIARIESVGPNLIKEEFNPKTILQDLRNARYPDQIRRTLLRLIAGKAIGWQDFVAFCPPDDVNAHYLTRDYLIAYMFDQMQEMNQLGIEALSNENLVS